MLPWNHPTNGTLDVSGRDGCWQQLTVGPLPSSPATKTGRWMWKWKSIYEVLPPCQLSVDLRVPMITRSWPYVTVKSGRTELIEFDDVGHSPILWCRQRTSARNAGLPVILSPDECEKFLSKIQDILASSYFSGVKSGWHSSFIHGCGDNEGDTDMSFKSGNSVHVCGLVTLR